MAGEEDHAGLATVPVRCSCGTCSEWALVELQGVLHAADEGTLAGATVGKLCVSPLSDATVNLVVGYHQLEGSVVALKKPLAVMQKVRDAAGGAELEVVGVIRKKLWFKNRPKALISKPDARAAKRQKLETQRGFFTARQKGAAPGPAQEQ